MIQISPKLHFHVGTLRQIHGNLQMFLMQIFSTAIRATPMEPCFSNGKTFKEDGICISILVYFTKKSIFSVHFHANN
jgi:hypothetical protein